MLVNRLGLRDQASLMRAETKLTALRRGTLQVPPAELERPESLSVIHRHVFQDVYAWAGQHRHVQIAKSQPFLPAELVQGALDDAFAGFRETLPARDREAIKGISGSDPAIASAAFAERLSRTVASVNYIHPFREGNGRTLRGFVDQVARTAGLELDDRKLDRQEWVRASIESSENIRNVGRLEAQLRGALAPLERSRTASVPTPPRARARDRHREDLER